MAHMHFEWDGSYGRNWEMWETLTAYTDPNTTVSIPYDNIKQINFYINHLLDEETDHHDVMGTSTATISEPWYTEPNVYPKKN